MQSVLSAFAGHDPVQLILLHLKDDGRAALPEQHKGCEMDAQLSALHNVLP